MASPLAAGAAAIVRQYFRSGLHPALNASPGARSSLYGTSFSPSGPMLKAVMIHGGTKMTGSYQGESIL